MKKIHINRVFIGQSLVLTEQNKPTFVKWNRWGTHHSNIQQLLWAQKLKFM